MHIAATSRIFSLEIYFLIVSMISGPMLKKQKVSWSAKAVKWQLALSSVLVPNKKGGSFKFEFHHFNHVYVLTHCTSGFLLVKQLD